MPRKKINSENSIQENAKIENDFKPTNLDQMLGVNGFTKYGTMDKDEYRESLDRMNRQELYAHASAKGVIPVTDRTRLVKSLVSIFEDYRGKFKPSRSVTRTEGKTLTPSQFRDIMNP